MNESPSPYIYSDLLLATALHINDDLNLWSISMCSKYGKPVADFAFTKTIIWL